MTPLTEAELIARCMQRCDRVLAGTERRATPRALVEAPAARATRPLHAKQG